MASSQPLTTVAQATADSSGNATFTFLPVPQNLIWIASIVVPNAPSGASFTARRGVPGYGENMGTWAGVAPFGPIRLVGLETLSVVATGLVAGRAYQCNFLGTSYNAADADLFELAGGQAGTGGVVNINNAFGGNTTIFGSGGGGGGGAIRNDVAVFWANVLATTLVWGRWHFTAETTALHCVTSLDVAGTSNTKIFIDKNGASNPLITLASGVTYQTNDFSVATHPGTFPIEPTDYVQIHLDTVGGGPPSKLIVAMYPS